MIDSCQPVLKETRDIIVVGCHNIPAGNTLSVFDRDVRNECECECECQSECEKRPLAKPDHNFFDIRYFFNRKKTLES